jgi:hypothetical protein
VEKIQTSGLRFMRRGLQSIKLSLENCSHCYSMISVDVLDNSSFMLCASPSLNRFFLLGIC